jgi:hypothetical protein
MEQTQRQGRTAVTVDGKTEMEVDDPNLVDGGGGEDDTDLSQERHDCEIQRANARESLAVIKANCHSYLGLIEEGLVKLNTALIQHKHSKSVSSSSVPPSLVDDFEHNEIIEFRRKVYLFSILSSSVSLLCSLIFSLCLFSLLSLFFSISISIFSLF